eukprot:TRINITY_DN2591_c1_g1_i1.p1 TRINITY_DN2591_c1_g1~~TRINITY_DN2591_c1_g1_i1.p1  ORF type:complete len:718 (+),score=120.92 TRINITY_DN2591_c1_g1_i1:48-2201(+)
MPWRPHRKPPYYLAAAALQAVLVYGKFAAAGWAAKSTHPLLSCAQSRPWAAFRTLVEAATDAGQPPCSAASAAAANGRPIEAAAQATSAAFHSALHLSRSCLPQMAQAFQRQASFFVLCEKYDEISEGRDWTRNVPIPTFEQDVLTMTTIPQGGHLLPCLFGWLTAVLCELRVVADVVTEAWPNAVSILKANWSQSQIEDSVELEKSRLMSALDGGDSTALQLGLRWILRDLLRGGHRALVLLESSGWPIQLAHILEQLPLGQLGAPLDEDARAEARSFIARTTTASPLVTLSRSTNSRRSSALRIWAVSLHLSLTLEVASLWLELATMNGLELVLTSALIGRNCSEVMLASTVKQELVNKVVRCTQAEALEDLFARSVGTINDGLGRFPLVQDYASFQSEFLRFTAFDPEIAEAHALLCGEPAFLCVLLHSLRQHPVIGYLGNPLGAYLPASAQEEVYSFVAAEAYISLASVVSTEVDRGRHGLLLVFMAPPIAAQAYWQTGVEFPVVRPLGRYTGASYTGTSRNVLVTKQIYTFWDFQCLLNRAVVAQVDWRFVYMTHLQDTSYTAWARHRAAVVLPYDPQTFVFYELYGMAVPLLVPAEAALPLFFMRSYGNAPETAHRRGGWSGPSAKAPAWGEWHDAASFNELRWWAMFSDVAEGMPNLLTWNSFAELLEYLLVPSGKLESASTGMRSATSAAHTRASRFWHTALGPLLSSP